MARRIIHENGLVQRGARNFDSLWEEESETKVQAPALEPAPEPEPVYEPSEQEIMSVRRLYSSMSDEEIVAYLKRKAPQQPRAENSPRSFSSSTREASSSPYWNAQVFKNETAISSEQLFPEQQYFGIRASLKTAFLNVYTELTKPS
jgi:hypothetical protein